MPPIFVLRPYDPREAASVSEIAREQRRSPQTVRTWLSIHALGRRVGGGPWQGSKVALAMWLDGDKRALAAYHAGDRNSDLVVAYYRRLGIPVPRGEAVKLIASEAVAA